jgi:hypothetical protein
MGVSRVTVLSWTRGGCPRNQDQSYSLPEVIGWRIGRAAGQVTKPPEQQSLENQKLQRQIQLQDLRIAELSRRAVPTEKVDMLMTEQCLAFREYWQNRWRRNTPDILRAMGLGANRAAELQAVIDRMVRQSMDDFKANARDVDWNQVDVGTNGTADA